MRKSLSAILVAFLIPALITPASFAVKAPLAENVSVTDKVNKQDPNVGWQRLGQGTEVWIFGSQVRVFECSAGATKSTLSLRGENGWTEVARTTSTIDRKICATRQTPYLAKYQFMLTISGQQDFPMPGTHAKLLVYRISTGQGSRQATAAVYEDVGALDEDQLDGNFPGTVASDLSGAAGLALAIPNLDVPNEGSILTPRALSRLIATAGWKGCFFEGVQMFGRVKFVSVGARFKIRVVGTKAALNVNGVTRVAKACGEWQFVSATPAFTVEIVRDGEDFTVSLGAKQPGVPK
jgi:hypothetical protein